ncbi:hypothetical protein ACK3SF_00990 [Candidatus Nanosalina sp. VS9-1]|uniref:hypothetical protein n=1 Tax=Candidatus Nanosalina sp. VS9-1 TaxID=3388566 RepID=UPI0039E106B4
MASDDTLERIEEIQNEIQELLSEAEDREQDVQQDLNSLKDKIQYLRDNARGAREPDELEDMTNIFVEACHHLVRDLRVEKEINQEIQQLGDDEETYIALMNRIQGDEIPEERRQRIQSQIGRIPKEDIESALQEDRELERREARETRNQIEELSEVFNDLSHNLKGRRMKSRLEDAREAWVQLTHVEAEL